jgi:2-aminoadipate transaminase
MLRLDDLFASRARDVNPPLYGASTPSDVPLISLAYGLADPAMFPQEDLLDAAAQVLAADLDAALNYGPDAPELHDLIVARLQREGVTAEREQVLVGYGSSQILGLLPQVLIEPGDTMIVEAPTFLGAVARFQRSGARMIGIPIDAQGMDVDRLEQVLRDEAAAGVRPKMIYTIPTFQNPTGASLSLERRQRVVELAARYGVLVVEDDAYIDLRFRGEPLPSLAALDEGGWVLRVGTFSKILAPGLRMGWAHGPRPLIERLAQFKVEGGSGPFTTRLVAGFAVDGRLERHIDLLRERYAERCRLMAQSLRRAIPSGIFTEPDGGFFIWMRLPPGLSATALQPQAVAQGVDFLPGPAVLPTAAAMNIFVWRLAQCRWSRSRRLWNAWAA